MGREILLPIVAFFIILLTVTIITGLENDVKTGIFVIDKSTTKNIVDISKITLTDNHGNVEEAVIESIGETNTKEFVFYNLDGTYKLEVSTEGYKKYEMNDFKADKSLGGGSLTISLEPLFKISCTERSSISKRIMAGTVNEINNLKINLNGLNFDNNLAIITAGRSNLGETLNFTKDTSFHKINLENQDYSILLESTEDYHATFQVFCGDAEEYINNYKGFSAFFGKLFCKLKNLSNNGKQSICILNKSISSN